MHGLLSPSTTTSATSPKRCWRGAMLIVLGPGANQGRGGARKHCPGRRRWSTTWRGCSSAHTNTRVISLMSQSGVAVAKGAGPLYDDSTRSRPDCPPARCIGPSLDSPPPPTCAAPRRSSPDDELRPTPRGGVRGGEPGVGRRRLSRLRPPPREVSPPPRRRELHGRRDPERLHRHVAGADGPVQDPRRHRSAARAASGRASSSARTTTSTTSPRPRSR